MRFTQDADAGERLRDVRGAVGRAVVDDDEVEVGVVQGGRRDQALRDRGLRVVGADHHGHRRPLVRDVPHGAVVPGLSHLERRSGRAVGPGQAEPPLGDRVLAHVPLVGPGEHARPGDPALGGDQ